MYCSKCGKEILDDAVMCVYCGCETNVKKSNGNDNIFAIVGFICSFFVSIAGLILSIIGLKKVKDCGTGKGFAIAGIVISSVQILICAAYIFLVYMSLFFSLLSIPMYV